VAPRAHLKVLGKKFLVPAWIRTQDCQVHSPIAILTTLLQHAVCVIWVQRIPLISFFIFSLTWSVQHVLGFLSIHLSSLAYEDLRGTLLLSLLKLCLLLMLPSLCDFHSAVLYYHTSPTIPSFNVYFFFSLILLQILMLLIHVVPWPIHVEILL